MSWHNDFDPDCENGHEPTAMLDDGPVLHGQSRTFVCPACGREILASNVPDELEPSKRELSAGSVPTGPRENGARAQGGRFR